MESVSSHAQFGRYSFFVVHRFRSGSAVPRPRKDSLAQLSVALDRYATPTVPGLPPFQGGAAGVLGYELGRCFERIPSAEHNEFDFPLALLGIYDVVLAWDHQSGDGWLISQGLPGT